MEGARESDPSHQREGREPQDSGHEDGGHPLSELLDGNLGALRFFNHANHVGEERVFADSCGPHFQGAILVDRGPNQRITEAFQDGHRLTGR